MPKIISNKSNVDLDYPVVRPSLDLDFTQEELDPRITFSRGSIGTRVNRNRLIETVAANQPRFDYDPVTGECKGLLIEESRVNSWINSGQSNVTGWNTGGVTLSFDNTVTAPDGTTNTIKCVETNTFTSGKNINQSISVTSGTSYTFSIFAKQPENSPLRYFSILFWNTGFTTYQIVTFDPKNGTVLFNQGGNTTFVEKYPNGWWRFGVTATATATAAVPFNIRFTNSISSSANPPYGLGGPYGNYTGDGSSFLYFYGPQVENGAFMTSFIPTTTAVTRSADLASMTGTNFSSWYNQSEGTVYSNTRMNGVQTGRYDRLWAITNSNLNLEGISVFVAGPAGVSGGYVSSITITNSATEQIIGTLVESAITTPNLRSAFAFATNNSASAYNGNLRFVDKSAILLSNPDRLLIGQPQRFQGTSCMTISRLTYYPRALKPSQLQYLTQ